MPRGISTTDGEKRPVRWCSRRERRRRHHLDLRLRPIQGYAEVRAGGLSVVAALGLSGDAVSATARVQDNGPGVRDDERERIFARFARGADAGAVQGSGLGLYLSRECARRMDGDLILEESTTGGSRFTSYQLRLSFK